MEKKIYKPLEFRDLGIFAERKKESQRGFPKPLIFQKKNPHIICSVCACLICPQFCVHFVKDDISTELLR